MPRLGRVIERPRLHACLDGFDSHPGLWLNGPPGAGKTTLLACWLRAQAQPVLWLRLDDGDVDPATLAASLDALWLTLLPPGSRLPRAGSDEFAAPTAWLRRRLRALLPRLPERWVLVLDDLHELPDDSPLHDALAAALAELHGGVRWVFASRQPPSPAYLPALAKGRLALLDAAALRLDEAEQRALLALHGRDEGLLPALQDARGWAAGLTVMLQGKTPPLTAHAGADVSAEPLLDHHLEQVLRAMPLGDREALMRLAHLPHITPALAVAQTDDPGAPALLQRLAAASLFVDRSEDGAPVYRLHALFAAMLRRRHERHADPAALRRFERATAHRLLAIGEDEAGIALLVRVQAWDEAAAAVAALAPRLAAAGRLHTLAALIGQLPDSVATPLLYWRALARLSPQPAVALADLEAALAAAQARGDGVAAVALAALAPRALLVLGRPGDTERWLDLVEQHRDALESLLAEPSHAARIVPGLVAAFVHRRPWHDLTPRLVDLAERLLERDHAPEQRLAIGAIAFWLLWAGEIERLQRVIDRLDALWDPGLAAPAALVQWWAVGIVVKCLLGQDDAAWHDAQRVLSLVDQEPALAPQRPAAEMQAVMVALARRDGGAARTHLLRARRLLRAEQVADQATFEIYSALLALHDGDAPSAQRLFAAALHTGRLADFAVREHLAMIGLALASAMVGDHAAAVDRMAEVRAHRIWPMCLWHHWVGDCVAAEMALRRGDRPAAVAAMRAALGTARRCGFRSAPLLRLVDGLMPGLMALALDEGIEVQVATDIVRRHGLLPPPGAGERWPWPVRIRALGPLQVEVDGAPLATPRKESRRLLELLRVLAAHGTAAVPLEQVADALWPDADGDAARNALDNALHRLRRLLGGEDRVLLRQGTLALNPQRCCVDVDTLVRQLDTARDDDHAAHALRRRAAAGDWPVLLPGDALPLVQAQRERLARRLAALHAAPRTAHDPHRRATLQAVAAGLATGIGLAPRSSARAQTGTVAERLLVGSPPGGTPDLIARALAAALPRTRVENRPGAGAMVAAQALLQSAADGSTLLLAHGGLLSLNPWVHARLPYDPALLQPLLPLAHTTFAVATGAAAPDEVVDIAALRPWAGTRGSPLTVGVPGIGTLPHVLAAALGQALSLKLQPVPYLGGPPALADLVGGRVDLVVLPEGLLRPLAAERRLRVLATSGAARSPRFPSVPTLIEAGLPLPPLGEWFAVMAHRALAPTRAAGLVDALEGARRQPPLRQALAEAQVEPMDHDRATLAAQLVDDLAQHRELVQRTGVRAH